ncbi:MAG TPA: TIGR03086 family metal-binding protein [Acidimicrobiales bacterium]|nr:TIGR03086 family metal-binding protein [Acidimicrobiales bacterium]
MIDLRAATDRTAAVIAALGDDHLPLPTPCPEYSVGDLLDHVEGLALAFTDAATKTTPDGEPAGPSGDARRLAPGWQQRIPARLAELARAWQDPSAWEGMTQAGGIDMPGEIAGLVALDEVIAHGWDLARATGQPFEADEDHVAACIATMGPQPGEERPVGTDVAFGRPVAAAPDAAPVDRLAAVLGRDPAWTP